MVDVPKESLDFIKSSSWVFSKTMPQWPHFYIVRNQKNHELFDRFADYVNKNGYDGQFLGTKRTYFEIGKYKYWVILPVINRALLEDDGVVLTEDQQKELVACWLGILDFIKKNTWRYAYTMPKWPHSYVHRDTCSNKDVFVQFVKFIRKYGYEDTFLNKVKTYYNIGEHRYWTEGSPVPETIILNRARLDGLKDKPD
jgi:hypothetical protein